MKKNLSFLFFVISISAFGQNSWIQCDSVNGPGKSSACVFTLNDDAYLLTGLDEFGFKRSMYSYDIGQDDWDDEESLGGIAGDGLNRGSAIAFNAGGYGFCGLGTGSVDYFQDLWKYDPVSNAWTQVADFEGEARREAVAFVIDGIAYVGTGQAASGLMNDFYSYDQATNTWTAVQSFPGTARRDAVGFAMGGQGYVGTGADASSYTNDFWCYYPLTDSWVQKSDFPGTPRHGAVGFGLFPTAFIALGEDNTFTYKKDTWEYNFFSDTWTQRANFPGPGRCQAIAVVVQGRAFVGTGYNGDLFDDFYEYLPLLSVDSELKLEANLFPNPASESFKISLNDASDLISMAVFSSDGRNVTDKFRFEKTASNQFTCSFSEIEKGHYFVVLTNGSNSHSCSVLIQ
ncbi:MAG: T9SS type A sorting domain-containing protein [Crocinitomicaceae bacterium]|nr:T9SS type A sorting domain-containing protein [Crocinitomicaceae bacterium]